METLDKHFRSLTRDVFARYGFAYGELIARGPEIVGEQLAPHCQPRRIRWPRGAAASGPPLGGTLLIEAAPGRALDLHYEVPRIIERVNGFYGYGAIAGVKITAGSGPLRGPVTATPPAEAPARLRQETETVEDPELRAALQRLAAGIASRAPSSPQGKE
jgi:hypothetical protein